MASIIPGTESNPGKENAGIKTPSPLRRGASIASVADDPADMRGPLLLRCTALACYTSMILGFGISAMKRREFIAARWCGARAGFQGATTLRQKFSTLSTERLDRAQSRHTIRIVHRHRRVFQRGRCGATLRKGRSMIGQAPQCTCAEGQRTGRSIDRSEPCHGWLLMR